MSAARRLLRRPLLWVPVIAVGLLAAWWFAWMTPQATKLASARQTKLNDQATIASLQAKVAQLKGVVKKEADAKHFLHIFSRAVPPAADAPRLVVDVYHLAERNHCKLQSITDNTVDTAGGGYSSIPVSLTVSGSRGGIVQFVDGLYRLKRLVTIQQLQLSGPANRDVLTGGGGTFTATISATAYTTSVTASSSASSTG